MELDKRLIELQEKIYRKYSLEKKLEELNESYFYLKDKLRQLIYKLEDMDININELDKKSIIVIWYDLFTSKGKSVSKIEHDYKIYSELYNFIRSEMIELKNKLEKIEEYNSEYRLLLEEKDKLTLESEKENYNKIEKLITESIKYKNRIRDINEAIIAGNYLDSSLKYLVELLNKSKDWDSFDIFGRGLFLSLTKTTVFKETEEKVKRLHYLGHKFIRELKVINFYMELSIDVSDIIHFVDYFENELYDDIKDKKRILKTIDNINNGYDTIRKVIDSLKINKENYLKQLLEIEKDKQKMI